MKKYLIERNIPGIGAMDSQQLRAAAVKSNQVLAELGPGVQWQQSFVTDDRLFCIYFANDKSLVKKHADVVGFPADRILEIQRTIDPSVDTAA
jgi:hypothetical protein